MTETNTEDRMGLVCADILNNPLPKPPEDAPIYQKIRWLNRYELSIQKVLCANKLTAKDYALKQAGDILKVAKTIQVFNNVSEMRLDEYPKSFIVKRSVGCAKTIYVFDKDSMDKNAVQREIDKWNTGRICGLESKEYQYSILEPQVFSEENLLRPGIASLVDYRFWTFNNRVAFVAVNGGRGWGSQVFYDRNFSKLDLYNVTHMSSQTQTFAKPPNFDLMVSTAEKLSYAFRFVRVDLYNVNGDVYLGEFTFSPGGYRTRFVDKNGKPLDVEIGKLLKI